MPVGVVQKLGADGEVRQGSLRMAADTSAEQRPLMVHFVRRQTLQPSEDGLELLASKRFIYVFASRAAIDDLMYRQPSIVFLKDRQDPQAQL